jgi:TonB family protein
MIDTALLNGLWQGALIALIATLMTIWIPKRHAATRYAVWFAALLALLVLPILTQWHPDPKLAVTPPVIVANTTAIAARATSDNGWWIIALWIAGVALGLARLVHSHLRITRITKTAQPAPNLGPDVVTSHDVVYPIAAGFFAPKVILPTNIVATLEPGDIEAIVRHERAHIARHDIFTNLAQRLIEACLFFNPWVYLIGLQLVKEREASCDDWAVATTDADRYASCLAQLAAGAKVARTPLLTPSAMGSRRMLVGRIARLLNGKAMQLKTNYFVLSASALAFALLAVLLQTTIGRADSTPSPKIPAQIAKCNDDVEVTNAAPPDMPKGVLKGNKGAEGGAVVVIAPDGHVVSAKIAQSTGYPALDKSLLSAARNSTYKPALSNCKAIQGSYYFHAVFSGDAGQ